MTRRPVSESYTMLSDHQYVKHSFDPSAASSSSSSTSSSSATFRQSSSEFSPTMMHQHQQHHQQQQQQQQQQHMHFASGQPQSHMHRQQAHKHLSLQQPFHRSNTRPASEILAHNPHLKHHSFNSSNFQSPEAEAIDRWFEDLSHYEQTLEEMAMVSLDHVFKDELSTIESWFRVLSEAERTAALYSLLQHSSQVQIRFFITVLQQMAKKDPVGALLSPTHIDKDPVQNQLHGAMAKAEMEASQRLLNVLPIQPPAPATLDRPATQRRLNDRHSVTIAESEEYNRMLRREFKRNSIDLLGTRAAASTKLHGSGPAVFNNPSSSAHGPLNGSGIHPSNGSINGVIGLNQYNNAPSQPNTNRTSAQNLFGGESVGSDTNNTTSSSNGGNGSSSATIRPKSTQESDPSASSMFSAGWNFASLGGTPLPSNSSNNNLNNGRASNSSTSPATSSLAGSPGHIGDRSSFGRPKSVGGADWMLSGSTHLGQFGHRQPSQASQQQQQQQQQPSSSASGFDGLENGAPWNALIKSPPTMGGFHNGSNGTGHGHFGSGSNNKTNGALGSDMVNERPKSVTETDFAKTNYNSSQWNHSTPGSHLPHHTNPAGGNVMSHSAAHHFNAHNTLNGMNGSRLSNGSVGSSSSGSMSSLEEATMKLNNRRRTLLRPSAIISNVPVTVLEGDEKLLSASANTSSINIVSSMFNEQKLSSGSVPSSSAPNVMSPPVSGAMASLTMGSSNAYNSNNNNTFPSHFAQQQQHHHHHQFQQQQQLQQQQLHQQQALLQLQNRSFQASNNSNNNSFMNAHQAHQHAFASSPSSATGGNDLSTFLQPATSSSQNHNHQHQHHYNHHSVHRRSPSPILSPQPSPTRSGFRSRSASRSTSPVPSYPPKSFSAGHALLTTLNASSSSLSSSPSSSLVLHHLQELELEDQQNHHLETDSGIGSGDGGEVGSLTAGSRSGSNGSIEAIMNKNSNSNSHSSSDSIVIRNNNKTDVIGEQNQQQQQQFSTSPMSFEDNNNKVPIDYNEKRIMTSPPRERCGLDGAQSEQQQQQQQRTISSSLSTLDDDYLSDMSEISNLGSSSSHNHNNTRLRARRARAGTVTSKTSIETVGGLDGRSKEDKEGEGGEEGEEGEEGAGVGTVRLSEESAAAAETRTATTGITTTTKDGSSGTAASGGDSSGSVAEEQQDVGTNNNDHEGSTTESMNGVKEKKVEGVDFELLQDTPAWLRSLRLHKYNNIFEGMQWRDIVNLSDGDLINKGVAALGARRKMSKVFEQVRKEMLLQGMVI